MDNEKAIRAAKLTLGGILEKRRAKTAVERAEGQIAPSKYMPGVPRQVHASGGYVPSASLPIPRLAVAAPLAIGQQPGFLDVLGTLNKVAGSARTLSDLVRPEREEAAPEPQAARAEARAEGLTPEASAAMEALRKGWTGADFGIVSGYRSPEENRAAKGAKDSQHIHGNAYDVDTTGWSPEDKLALADEAWNAGFRGFGFYDNNMHFDVADPRAWGPSYSRDSIPDWAQGWAQERYGYAEGGEVTDLGQAREAKQMQTYHTGMMDDIHQRMSNAMEAHEKAVGQGVFDGYEVGDTLQGSAHPMRITGRYMQKWKPTSMALRSFERMGTEPTIIEHEGEQYIPMLRYETGKEGVDGFQQGSAYLDGVKAAGYQKMGGLRAVKARGGSVSAKEKFLAGNHPDVPEVVYHATQRDFSTFKKGSEVQVNFNNAQKNLGHFFTDDPGYAGRYVAHPWGWGGYMENSSVMPVHLSMKNPKIEDASKIDEIESKWTDQQSATYRKQLEDMGHDGIIFKGTSKVDPIKEFVAFHPHQIKSAIGNNGDFDPTNPDITKARGGAVEFMRDNHPLVPDELYHGSAPKVATKGWTDEVDEDQTAKNIAAQDFKEFKPSAYGSFGEGIYLTDKPEVASTFAQGIRADQTETKPHGQVMKLHVSMKQPFHDDILKNPAWVDYIKGEIAHAMDWRSGARQNPADKPVAEALLKKLDNGTATVRDLFLHDSQHGAMVNQFGQDKIHKTIRNSGFDGIIAHRPDGSKEYVAFKPEQVKSALSARKFDPTSPDMTYADGGAVPQKTVKAYKLFRTKGDGKLYPLFVNAEKPVPMGEWLEAEEGPQGKSEGKVKSKLGDLAYRPGWHAGDLPMATHIGGKSDPSLKKPDYRPDNHVWAEVEMAADKDWQSVADSRGKGVKAHITDQVPYGGFYRYKTNPNMTGNWLIGGNMKVNRVLPDEEVKAINDQAGTADLPRRSEGFAAGGAAMFEGMHEDLQDEQGKPMDLWHGTPSEGFNEFDNSKVGSERDAGFYGRGHYLTPDYDTAEEYASHSETGEVGKVMGPLHAALKNPFVWDMSDENKAYRTKKDLETMGIKRDGRLNPWDNLMSHEIDTFMKHMNQRGHDGVIVKQPNWQDGEGSHVTEIVVFKPTAIKHKDAERFDPNDPNIYHARGGVAK